MSLLYSMVAIGKTEPERDIVFMFRQKAPFKINSASGAFRVFITELKLSDDRESYKYKGTVADTNVEGFFNPKTRKGTILFFTNEMAKFSK